MRRLAICVAVLAAVRAHAATPPAHTWSDYANVKYQFQICTPADVLKGAGESDSSDGQIFTAADGARLTASGIYNIDGDSTEKIAAQTAARLAGPDGAVTYRHVGKDSFVLSGRAGGNIFYTKAILSHGTLKHFEFVYPSSQAGLYNPIAAHLQGCFKDSET